MNARVACKLIEIRVSRIMEELKEIEKP